MRQDEYRPVLVEHVAQGIIDNASFTLPFLIEQLESGGAKAAGECAYILGEIAFKQGRDADPRILASLIQGMKRLMPQGTTSVESFVYAIREYARAAPVAAARDALLDFLKAAATESDPSRFALRNAIETVLLGDGDEVRGSLQRLYDTVASEHPLAVLLEELLSIDPIAPPSSLPPDPWSHPLHLLHPHPSQ